jgi:type II secretory pathway predicted ATPase ExeA
MRKFTEWFGLTRIPFDKDIDEKSLFLYSQVEELSQKLELAVESQTGALVTGQAGTGKTTATRVYLEGLPPNRYRVIYLGYDQTGRSMFARLAAEFGMKLTHNASKMMQLSQYIKRHVLGSNKQLILVVDEAHLLDWRTLEDIRLLTNSEMDKKTAITLILLGQLWLRSKLKSAGSEALYQRMRFRYGLEGLSKKQTGEYIQQHLKLVGCSKELFTEGAYNQIFLASGGILREINNLCVDALVQAANQGLQKVDEKLMKLVIDQRETS